MANYTLSYSEGSKGWPSFYSYTPDWMIGMNQYFYTFNGGSLYRHDTNTTTMNFYGVQYSASIQGVFNDAVLKNKLFKTLSQEASEAWDVTLQTDLQNGFADKEYFEQKEGAWFSYVRVTTPTINDNFLLRSVSGIANADSVDATDLTAVVVTFDSAVEIGTIISVGDIVYYAVTDTPVIAGAVTATGTNSITINVTASSGTAPSAGNFILYVKSGLAESHGVLGRYCIFTLSNDVATEGSLFVFKTEVMASYPQ